MSTVHAQVSSVLNFRFFCRTLIYKKLVRNNEQDQVEANGTAARGSVLLEAVAVRDEANWPSLAPQSGWGISLTRGLSPQSHGSTIAPKPRDAALLEGLRGFTVGQSCRNNWHVPLSSLQEH